MGSPAVLTVVLTGILLVFLVLVLLTVLITIFGGVMKAFAKKPTEVKSAPAVPAPAPVAPKAAPIVAKSDDTEIIAVIAAAVAAMGGGTVVSVQKAQPAHATRGAAVNAWKQSTVLSYLQQV